MVIVWAAIWRCALVCKKIIPCDRVPLSFVQMASCASFHSMLEFLWYWLFYPPEPWLRNKLLLVYVPPPPAPSALITLAQHFLNNSMHLSTLLWETALSPCRAYEHGWLSASCTPSAQKKVLISLVLWCKLNVAKQCSLLSSNSHAEIKVETISVLTHHTTNHNVPASY